MTRSAEYDERVRAWAGQLRIGAPQTWTDFLRRPAVSAHPLPVDQPLPGAAQLELVRRLLDQRPPELAGLADLVMTTAGAGRGRVDVPLPWPGSHDDGTRFGSPPTAPEELPAEELLRVGVASLVRLLADEHPEPPAVQAGSRWRPIRKGFTLLGAPTTVALLRRRLLEQGLREGGRRSTYLVLGGPLEELMEQRWSARVRAGAAMRWQRMWRTAAAHDRVPPGIALPVLAARLSRQFGSDRVHVVLAPDPDSAAAQVAALLGVRVDPLGHRPDTLSTDLLRRVNPLLTLAAGEQHRREVVETLWPSLAGGETSGSLAAPRAQLEWAVGAGERMAAALAAADGTGDYRVHGDPALLVPTRRPGAVRAPDPDAVLGHALVVLGRAWRRHVAGPQTLEKAGEA